MHAIKLLCREQSLKQGISLRVPGRGNNVDRLLNRVDRLVKVATLGLTCRQNLERVWFLEPC